ncbi:MAG: hypothetical protein FWE64_01960 [Alphaproteobacteria bacterium]|nr:hypothetical protein [Alphaproteobacteria bacterium]
MKKATAFFAIVFVASGLAHADVSSPAARSLGEGGRPDALDYDAARAATRAAPAGAATQSAQAQPRDQRTAPSAAPVSAPTGRGGGVGERTAPAQAPQAGQTARATIQAPAARSLGEGGRTIAARSAVDPSVRSTAETGIPRAAATPVAQPRTAVPAPAARSAIPQTAVRGAMTPVRGTAVPGATAARTARAAPTRTAIARSAATADTGATVAGGGYRACRDAFFHCMDELCANKDTQLKRCACSARTREFDGMRRQLDEFNDRIQDFNANLLTVAMDREDAEAIMRATEGEEAFHGMLDLSESAHLLNSIMESLRNTTESQVIERSLAAINISMDFTDPFDSIDMRAGADMTMLEGEALHRAALPVCREIAAEVCAPGDIPIVESAYQMAIEQDCNAVSRAFAGLFERARERVNEGHALLDIARLQNFQTRNADDILTCRRRMITMLSDAAVCGAGLDRCLDPTGIFIDPGTGNPILTGELFRLGFSGTVTRGGNSVVGAGVARPIVGQTWARANTPFVQFLHSKRKYIEPAMAGCEQIADHAWMMFLEDAIPQIRVQQGRKLEDMRQACTGIVAQCISGTAQSFQDFDARSVSIFGLAADRAVNAICADVQTACTALMVSPHQDSGSGQAAGEGWADGMTMIATRRTFDQIMQTCRLVGENCIVRNCSNISGKFGLCMTPTQRQRRNIMNRSLCWSEVYRCVNEAGPATLTLIMDSEFFAPIPLGSSGRYSNCQNDVGPDQNQRPQRWSNRDACQIAEHIWGNCDKRPDVESNNPLILHTNEFENTLLAWIRANTGSGEGSSDSCYGFECPTGTALSRPDDDDAPECVSGEDLTNDGWYCPANITQKPDDWPRRRFNVTNTITNCCIGGALDGFNNDPNSNCCIEVDRQRLTTQILRANNNSLFYYNDDELRTSMGAPNANHPTICLHAQARLVAHFDNGFLFCVNGNLTQAGKTNHNNDDRVNCAGQLVFVDRDTRIYRRPAQGTVVPNDVINRGVQMEFNSNADTVCSFNASSHSWGCSRPDRARITRTGP